MLMKRLAIQQNLKPKIAYKLASTKCQNNIFYFNKWVSLAARCELGQVQQQRD